MGTAVSVQPTAGLWEQDEVVCPLRIGIRILGSSLLSATIYQALAVCQAPIGSRDTAINRPISPASWESQH